MDARLPLTGSRRIAWCVLLGVLAAPPAAAAACGGRWNLRRTAASVLILAVWAAAFVLLALHPVSRLPLVLLLGALNAAASAAAAAIAPPRAPRETPRHPVEPAAVLLGGGLAYAACVFAAGVALMMLKMSQFDVKQMIGPEIFLWCLPAFVFGGLLGAYWSVEAGPAAGRYAASSILAAALTQFLIGIATLIAVKLLLSWGVVFSGIAEPRFDWSVWKWSAVSFAALLSLAAWAGSAPSAGGAFARVLASAGIWLAFTANLSVVQGRQFDVQVRWAVGRMLEPGLDERRAGVDRLAAALAVEPETPIRGYALWTVATENAALGRDDEALAAFTRVAALPEDALGQDFVLRARRMLNERPAGAAGRAVEAPGAFAVEATDYMSSDWRSVMGLWRAALPKEGTTGSLSRLEKISLSDRHIRLPRLDGWSSLAAYSSLYGAPVAVSTASVERVAALIDAGKPVLVRRQDRFLLIVGRAPSWRSFIYLEYKEEQPWLAAELARSDAAGAVSDNEALRVARLAKLQRMIVESMTQSELERALSDSGGLAAWPDAAAPRPDPAVRAWLLGEDAMNAGDPVRALQRYDRAAALGAGTRLEPYVGAAALAAERHAELAEADETGDDPSASGFSAWRSASARRALIARFLTQARSDPSRLPSPVLVRLTDVLDRLDPAEAPLLRACAEERAARFPSDAEAWETAADLRREAGDDAGWRTAALAVHSERAQEPGPLLDAAEASVRLKDYDAAEGFLARVNPFVPAARGRRSLLAGRAALGRGRLSRARRDLEAALAVDRSDPRTHRYLAEVLEGLGRKDEALGHWRWVLTTGLDAEDLALARARAGADR